MGRKLPKRLSHHAVDRVWSELVKVRWNHKCAICGSRQHPNSHHIMGKRSRILRYSLDNGICLCVGHHLGGVHSSDGSVALDTIKRIQEILGPVKWEMLLDLKQDKRKLSLNEALEQLTG